MANSYCEFVASGKANPLHVDYHDREYGFPIVSDDELLERLTLEIFQAGLSWELILKRRPYLKSAFRNYDPDILAAWQPPDIEEFLLAEGVIKNRAKVEATVFNAKRIVRFSQEGTSFRAWLTAQPSQELPDWVKTMKAEFKFVGSEVVREFLTSIGILEGAHDETCPIYSDYLKSRI